MADIQCFHVANSILWMLRDVAWPYFPDPKLPAAATVLPQPGYLNTLITSNRGSWDESARSLVALHLGEELSDRENNQLVIAEAYLA